MKAADRKKIIAAATALLYARRAGNIRLEQDKHRRLVALCQEHCLDFGDVLSQVTAHLRKTSIAASMNGIL